MRVEVKACAVSFAGNWRLATGGVSRSPGLLRSDGGQLFRDPEAGGPGAGIVGHFLVGGPHGMTGDYAEGGPVAAGADWLLGWADAVFGLDVEE